MCKACKKYIAEHEYHLRKLIIFFREMDQEGFIL